MPKRLDEEAIAAARAALRAIEDLPDYQPLNQAYSVAALQQLEATYLASEDSEERARLDFERSRRVYEQARSVRADTGRGLCHTMHSAKTQVLAQYGDDSYAVEAIGWTRRSEWKRPGRRKAAV